jgi:hypothetical protein
MRIIVVADASAVQPLPRFNPDIYRDFFAGSLGITSTATIYAIRPGAIPVITVKTIQDSRTSVGSTSKYVPIPPQTPASFLSFAERYNFFVRETLITPPWLYVL